MVSFCLPEMIFQDVSFERDHHTAILIALRALDGDYLMKTKCYFGRGTAIVLELGEYRKSIDIDFLCADRDGYRALRTAIAGQPDLNRLLRAGAELKCPREVRADQYGLRTMICSQGIAIKLEIVRETRIDLEGEVDPRFGVPVLSRHHMYAEKLMANSDRWYQPDVASRDILDLSVMISRWGPVPDEAWAIAENACGMKAREDFEKAVEKIRKPEHIESCARKMQIDPEAIREILAVHGGAFEREPSPFD